MAGIVGVYNIVPRIRTLVSDNLFEFVSGSGNPVDSGPVYLRNVRGQLTITTTDVDTGYVWKIEVNGGFGEFSSDPTQNFVLNSFGQNNCTATVLQTNRIQVTTPVGDSGGRRYILQFTPLQSIAPTIYQTSVNTLTGDLNVRVEKPVLVAQ